jgi:hypothetical protein
MTLRIPSLAALALCIAAAASLAAPPLAIPIPRPTPEQEAQIAAEEEAALRRTEIEEAYRYANTDSPAAPVETPEPSAGTPAPAAETSASAVETPEPPASTPEPPVETPVPAPSAPVPAPATTKPASSKPAESANASTNAVFRRDPFWPVAVARQRKADHDARVAARIEAEKRAALIAKKRQEAIAKGEDVELLDDEFDGSGAAAGPSGSAKRPSGGSFAGATDEEWDAAFAKLPPRSGYLGGKKPALMLKGDKTPHFAGEKLCVTNRNVVFTWRVSSVDFRSYTHELKRVSAKPVNP